MSLPKKNYILHVTVIYKKNINDRKSTRHPEENKKLIKNLICWLIFPESLLNKTKAIKKKKKKKESCEINAIIGKKKLMTKALKTPIEI